MLLRFLLYAAVGSAVSSATLMPRLDNGLALTPQMGWNTYNHYSCSPNESIVHSNAQALVDLGLSSLGYRYVTTDCGWTVADRLPDGSLTWNDTLFPQGFPAMGEYLHDLGLLFGVYQDSGILLCGSPPNETGSLYHEAQDAETFASWNIDSLKYDNCYSDAATDYPNVNYAPSTSPEPRFANMSHALLQQNKTILFQICEWGISFPAHWAPSIGHSWRIGNDIIPDWRTIFRIINQAAPQTDFAGPGQWPDLDMLEVGNNVFSLSEEETHFSLWAILKSPLIIGAALKDELTAINDASLGVLKQTDVIAYNQDSLGKSASLHRRWTEGGYEVWSGPLSNDRTVAAVINWHNESRDLTLDLPDIGLQHAGTVKNIWGESTAQDVRTSYTATVAGHGTMLLELQNTTEAGVYSTAKFGNLSGQTTTFGQIYAVTTSSNYTLTIYFSETSSSTAKITIGSSASNSTIATQVPASSASISAKIPLTAGSSNTITLDTSLSIDAIHITAPNGTYYPCTNFTLAGSSTLTTCGTGYCQPVGSKIGYISPSGTAQTTVSVTTSGSKYLEIDYINNEIAFDSSWGWGSNSRNLTVTVNDEDPVRIEVPLSGRHSELFGPGLGWWDTATLGLLTTGWKEGSNEVVIGNVGGDEGFQSYGADFVGVRVLD
ncbi:putative alpha-galactosidase D [Aspergillus sclerotiicarbonarius CBS 121057]|uniref:Alpha-galactosidase n=1 Tax=Aspergillus sclerotiicarbonarius (strain CBS 121057 / IBT 28362) TaxID=1448318 RepID=A0A319FNL4_ASPSB|nr:putative alpha-galactosidase D [Aspergillus sclerotiicarbonarius CBS 121057]